jgi:hypothetical protein
MQIVFAPSPLHWTVKLEITGGGLLKTTVAEALPETVVSA